MTEMQEAYHWATQKIRNALNNRYQYKDTHKFGPLYDKRKRNRFFHDMLESLFLYRQKLKF